MSKMSAESAPNQGQPKEPSYQFGTPENPLVVTESEFWDPTHNPKFDDRGPEAFNQSAGNVEVGGSQPQPVGGAAAEAVLQVANEHGRRRSGAPYDRSQHPIYAQLADERGKPGKHRAESPSSTQANIAIDDSGVDVSVDAPVRNVASSMRYVTGKDGKIEKKLVSNGDGKDLSDAVYTTTYKRPVEGEQSATTAATSLTEEAPAGAGTEAKPPVGKELVPFEKKNDEPAQKKKPGKELVKYEPAPAVEQDSDKPATTPNVAHASEELKAIYETESALMDRLSQARESYAKLTAKERNTLFARLLKEEGMVSKVLSKVPGIRGIVKKVRSTVNEAGINTPQHKELIQAKTRYGKIKSELMALKAERLKLTLNSAGADVDRSNDPKLRSWLMMSSQTSENNAFDQRVLDYRTDKKTSWFSRWYERQKGFKGSVKKLAVFGLGGVALGAAVGGPVGLVAGSVLAAKFAGGLAGATYGVAAASHVNRRRAHQEHASSVGRKAATTWAGWENHATEGHIGTLTSEQYSQTMTDITEDVTDQAVRDNRAAYRYAYAAAFGGVYGGELGELAASKMNPGGNEIEITSPSDPRNSGDLSPTGGSTPDAGDIGEPSPPDVLSGYDGYANPGNGPIHEITEAFGIEGVQADYAFAEVAKALGGPENMFVDGANQLYSFGDTVHGAANMGFNNAGPIEFTPEAIELFLKFKADLS